MKLKKYKYLIIACLVMVVIIAISFYQVYQDHFSYEKGYYEIKEKCYEGKDSDHEYCKRFTKKKYLESYIKINDPKKAHKELDAITLTCDVVENSLFSILQIFSPLVIIFCVVGFFNDDISTGMIKNYLLRQSHKDYLRKSYYYILKCSLLMPISLILIFIISMFITGYNFEVANSTKSISVYSEWKYNNFILYGFIICLIQYFMSLLYAHLGVLACKKNKNKLVSIVMGYIFFLVINISIYVFYGLVVSKLFGVKGLSDYFNIAGYWFFDNGSKIVFNVLIALILYILSVIIMYLSYKDKEGVILTSEKQMA